MDHLHAGAIRVIACLLLLTFLSSCKRDEPPASGGTQAVLDDFGVGVHLPRNPQRIVSLAPSVTETLFALGVEGQVIGVTDFCDFPEAARGKPKVGGILNPNIERIVELKPDVVIMSTSGNMRGDYDKLKALGVSLFVTNPRSLNGVLKSIRDLGSLIHREDTADSVVAALRAKLRRLEETTKTKSTPRVLFLLSLNPIVTVGQGAFLDELITLAHGHNISGDAGMPYPMISREEIYIREPEVILATHDVAMSVNEVLAAYPEWSRLPAVRDKRVVLLDANLVTRPGPRIVDALEAIILGIHSRP